MIEKRVMSRCCDDDDDDDDDDDVFTVWLR